MMSLVRNVSLILFFSVVLPIPVSIVLSRISTNQPVLRLLLSAGFLVLVLFTIPLLVVYVWAAFRMRQFGILTERATLLAAGNYELDLREGSGSDEALGLVRSLEAIRTTLVGRRQTLEQQNRAFIAILDGLAEGIVAIDRTRTVVLSNGRASEIFGARFIRGNTYLETVRSTALSAAVDRALKGLPSTLNLLTTHTAEPNTIAVRVAPLDAEPEMAVVIYFVDVSRLEQLERVRREFLSDFSHEVRTPLAGLRSAIESFDSDLDPGQEVQLQKIIDRQLQRLERLVRDLAELSQIESGDIVLEKEPANLFHLLTDLADEIPDERLGGRKIEVVGDEALLATVDRFRAQQIFTNLIDNALKYGGSSDLRIEVSSVDRDVVVSVADEGPGIPLEERGQIFRRFYRVDKSRSQQVAGSGLGLAITRHLVLQHGGTISVERGESGGSIFLVRLPK